MSTRHAHPPLPYDQTKRPQAQTSIPFALERAGNDPRNDHQMTPSTTLQNTTSWSPVSSHGSTSGARVQPTSTLYDPITFLGCHWVIRAREFELVPSGARKDSRISTIDKLTRLDKLVKDGRELRRFRPSSSGPRPAKGRPQAASTSSKAAVLRPCGEELWSKRCCCSASWTSA